MTEKQYDYTYRAFGLNIASQIPITGFKQVPFEVADVSILEGVVPKELDNIINRGVLYQSNEHEFIFRLDGIGAFYIQNGSEIIVQRYGSTSFGEISVFISGTAIGALLHQRRLLPLHSSTVIFNGKCLLFAGISGVGKTTLAAAILKAGGSLVADDISVIDFTELRPAVRPAYPNIKIWSDSLNFLDISLVGLERVRSELQKYYLPIESFSNFKSTIDTIFVLNTHNKESFEVKTLQGFDKFRVLKKNTYLFRGIPKTGLELNHFQEVSRLANQVPVKLLFRPDNEFNTCKMIEEVEKNC